MNGIAEIMSIESRWSICSVHGAFESKRVMKKVWSSCPSCNAEAAAKREADEAEAKATQQRARIAKKIGNVGIPERFANRTLDSYIASNKGQAYALQVAEKYAREFAEVRRIGRCALFAGKPGTGKTHLAAGICLSIMDRYVVMFTTTLRAIRRVKDTWSNHRTESESQAVDALVLPDLLVLDEVGIQFGSEVEKMILFDVLNERYEKRKPTLLLSNLPVDEIKNYLGERIFDRLREDGGELVVFDWESQRGRIE